MPSVTADHAMIHCRRLFQTILICSCSVASAQQAALQPPATAKSLPIRDTTAITLLDGAFNSIASASARQALHSVVMTGTVSLPGNPTTQAGTFTAKLVGHHFLLDTTIGAHRTRYSSMGRHGQVNVDGKTSKLTISGASDIGPDIFPPLEPWASYADSTVGVRGAPDQVIDGIGYKEVDIQRPMGFTLPGHSTDDVRIFLDKNTGLVHAVDYAMNQTQTYNPNIRMRVIYADYARINGILLPTTITRLINGRPITILHILNVNTRQIFDDSALGL